MKRSITRECASCQRYFRATWAKGPVTCGRCGAANGAVGSQTLEHGCPFCDCRQFYKQKDFPPLLGCGIVLLGAVLVPWTFGLSLPVLAVADWILYRKVGVLAVCYRCRTEFRGDAAFAESLESFSHHTGELHETSHTTGR